jgi:vacuolar-type H+-ATPase subunit H
MSLEYLYKGLSDATININSIFNTKNQNKIENFTIDDLTNDLYQNKIENFDANLIPEYVYTQSKTVFNINANELRIFATNIDTNLIDMTDSILTNRISVLTEIKNKFTNQIFPEIKRELAEKGREPVPPILVNNIDSMMIFIIRIIDMVIVHSQQLKLKLSSGSNIEFFTLSPMIDQIPPIAKTEFNKFLSKYGVSYDNVIEFINKLEISPLNLTSKSKINRLKILHIFKQVLYSISGYENIFINYYRQSIEKQEGRIPSEEIDRQLNIIIQLMDVIYYIVNYLIDLHLKELYLSMTAEELKIGLYFEKFISYYPKDTEAVKKELSLTNKTLLDIQNKITEYEKSKFELEKQIANTRAEAEKNIANARTEAERNIANARAEAERNIANTRLDVDKYKGESQKYKTDFQEAVSQRDQVVSAMERDKKQSTTLIIVLVVFILLCLVMTVMYFMK